MFDATIRSIGGQVVQTVLKGRRRVAIVIVLGVSFGALAMQSASAGTAHTSSVRVSVLRHSKLLWRSLCEGGGAVLAPGQEVPPCPDEIRPPHGALLSMATDGINGPAVVSGTVNISSTIAAKESVRFRVGLYVGQRKVEGAVATVTGPGSIQVPIQAVVRPRGQAVALVVRHQYEQAGEVGAVRIVDASLIVADH